MARQGWEKERVATFLTVSFDAEIKGIGENEGANGAETRREESQARPAPWP